MSEKTATREIQLFGDKVTLLDANDYDRIRHLHWCAIRAGDTWYVQATEKLPTGKRTVMLHRLIMDAPQGIHVDHRNRNGLDNRRENLRLASNSQNNHNTPRRTRNRSGFKGVHPSRGLWAAQIQFEGVRQFLGRHSTPEAAAAAYDEAAIRLVGEFAWTNFAMQPCSQEKK